MKYGELLIGLFVAMLAEAAVAQQSYFVAEHDSGAVYRLCDLNGDGDAFDADEKTLWAEGLSLPGDLCRYEGSILAIESTSGNIIQLTDLNEDGDARDPGESTIWADGFGGGAGLAQAAGGAVMVVDGSANEVWRLTDANGDGDARDEGESGLYAHGIPSPRDVMPRHGDMLLTTADGAVRRLVDLNGDGDAMDFGEYVDHAPPGMIADPSGATIGLRGGYFVASTAENIVYCVSDANGDGDAFDYAEVLSYADDVFGGIAGPGDMAPLSTGGFLLCESGDNEIAAVRDVNGDGDALDDGEVFSFADVGTPTGLIAGIGPGPVGTMISIQDGPGTLDRAAPNCTAIVGRSTLATAAVNGALDAGVDVFISTDNPAGFAPGRIVQNVDAPLVKSAGDRSKLVIRADDDIELHGGISADDRPLDVELMANDPGQSSHDLDSASGDVLITAPVDTAGGTFSSSGVNFQSIAAIEAGQIVLEHTGSVTIAGSLNAAGATLVADGGVLVADGGQLSGDVAVGGDLSMESGSKRTVRISGEETLDDLTIDGGLDLAAPDGDLGALLDLVWLPGATEASMFGGTYCIATYRGSPASGQFVLGGANGGSRGSIGARYVEVIDYAKSLGGDQYAIEVSLYNTDAGDINVDGFVDVADLSIFSGGWNPSVKGESDRLDGDLDFNGFVDVGDLSMFSHAWAPGGVELTTSNASGSTAIPEPGTVMMLLAALVLWLLPSCRRRS